MGLTISYTLSSRTKTAASALKIVERIRQIAMDLPFDEVGDIHVIDDPKLFAASNDELREKPGGFSVMMSEQSVTLPWSKFVHRYPRGGVSQCQKEHRVRPSCIVEFDVQPTDGCETATFALCQYPNEVTVVYDPRHDRKYQKVSSGLYGVEWFFDHKKFSRQFNDLPPARRYAAQEKAMDPQTRVLKTRFGGWQSREFCKTQYASDPESGGIPNFLRAHLSLVTLLERASEIPGLKVDYNDEGHYGQSTYTDDWTVPNPVYTLHPATYNVPVLLKQLGDYNELIAGFAGALRDALGADKDQFDSPILDFANFEQLEFRGSRDERIKPFLEAMRKIAQPVAS